MRLKTTWQHIRRSPYQSLAAVLIMALTFFIASIFIVIGITGEKAINHLESTPQVIGFFKDEASREEIAKLQTSLTDTGKVSSTRFVSKEEALKKFREFDIAKEDPLITDLVTASILPASLEVSAVNPGDLAQLASKLKSSEIVDRVVFLEDVVDKLISLSSAIRKIGVALFSILSIISIFTIINVIGMKISLRREEIEILRLVGASAWYIRLPFIVEGALYGVIGSLVAWLITYGIVLYAAPFIKSFLFDISILPISPYLMLGILGVEVVAAMLLGVLASFMAVLRYLK